MVLWGFYQKPLDDMKIKDRILPLITIALIIALWYAAASIYGIELILPTPTTAIGEMIEAFKSNEFWVATANTLLRSVVAFIIAFVAALALALISARFKTFFKMFYPVVVVLRALPTISVIFICYIAVTGWFRAVIICLLVIFPTLFSSFYTALKGCEGQLAEVSVVFGVRQRHVLTKYIIPSVWNSMYSDVVNTISLTVKLIIAAEAVTATGISLGGLMSVAKANIEMGEIFAYTVVAIVVSYLTELIVRLIARVVKEISQKCRLR